MSECVIAPSFLDSSIISPLSYVNTTVGTKYSHRSLIGQFSRIQFLVHEIILWALEKRLSLGQSVCSWGKRFEVLITPLKNKDIWPTFANWAHLLWTCSNFFLRHPYHNMIFSGRRRFGRSLWFRKSSLASAVGVSKYPASNPGLRTLELGRSLWMLYKSWPIRWPRHFSH